MKSRNETLAEAARCCMRGACDKCPMQGEICDELMVEMVDVPAELLEMIVNELAEERTA